MRKPVAILAFANLESNPLPGLAEEADRIQEILQLREKSTGVQPIVFTRISLDRIGSMLRNQNSRIELFHYAGHSADGTLGLHGGAAAFGQFGRVLHKKHRTKLVFLNACGTEKMARELWEAGIPAIVVTQSAVTDEMATAFAQRFYEALTEDFNIEESFKYAREMVVAKHRNAPNFAIRHLMSADAEPSDGWVLYLRREDRRFSKWKLSQSKMRKRFWRRVIAFIVVVALMVGAGIGYKTWQTVHESASIEIQDKLGARIFKEFPLGYNLIVRNGDKEQKIPLSKWGFSQPLRYARHLRGIVRLYIEKNEQAYSDPNYAIKDQQEMAEILVVSPFKLNLCLPGIADLSQLPGVLSLELYTKDNVNDKKTVFDTLQINVPESFSKENGQPCLGKIIIEDFLPFRIADLPSKVIHIRCLDPGFQIPRCHFVHVTSENRIDQDGSECFLFKSSNPKHHEL
jgi:hypothetical protein